ncbi:tRNA (cytidine(34)-2'-O)-methyltransferase [Sphingomonas sp.]|jgi:tRNA (cytidine/uridine-2'-O-)-methyltransferase|uniref:tRNA (cytidine(34)-2'-O)-methyltransferase n=1 Tax=Sphingomonas sp. TaxID=28214 RepID=UPI00261519F1|nr:tRNA (cytidine(34)-2'-O)-methyltransferase [Sphingomonas sp.]MDF2494142.1 tRNA ((34)-2-O)-methyltransferase [Sphingomonas sp.]
MRLALYEPDIAGNVGTIVRTAACFGVAVDLIEPMGFPWSDKALRRSAMDYLPAGQVTRHADWAAFQAARPSRIVLASTRGAVGLWDARFEHSDTLLFGSESAGVPDAVHGCADLTVRIPLREGMRSLNVAVSAGIILAEALRQLRHASPPSSD